MKKYLISQKANYYKVNLHCHTTCSDGKMTLEQIKDLYKRHGYSAVAFTDHDIYLTHNDLTDDTFVALNGFEVEIGNRVNDVPISTCHLCFVAKDKNNDIHPLWHRNKYYWGNATALAPQVKFDPSLPDYEREYTTECVNEMIRIGKEKGFFVTWNHPVWSFEFNEFYINYEGMDAMEIFNNSSFKGGFYDYCPRIYDELLRKGKKLYCVSTDDNHCAYPEDHPLFDACGGYVMVRSNHLTYEELMESLENGDFYSSRGPMIHDITFDNETNIATISFSKANKVFFVGDKLYRGGVKYIEGEGIKTAEFKVDPTVDFFRFTVVDESGNTADSNAYFVKDLK